MKIIKRRIKSGLVFFNEDRTYRSKVFQNEEKRDNAIEDYIKQQLKLEKELELKRKRERDLVI